ncbi:hypothetical protein FOA52_004083 [Chlamydomonas sp. UWO 241]|nr:hypothetical protein FOA52_004083 [Chlamydomonas sp. UWO 241]
MGYVGTRADTKRNFPDEVISEPPVSLGDERIKRKTLRFKDVSWYSRNSAWEVKLFYPQTRRSKRIRYYDSELDAAMAHDYAGVELHGPGWPKLNFPDEVITKPPESRGDERKRLKASR